VNIISSQRYSEYSVTIQRLFNSAFWTEPQGLSSALPLSTVTNVKEAAGKSSPARSLHWQARFVRTQWTRQQLYVEW